MGTADLLRSDIRSSSRGLEAPTLLAVTDPIFQPHSSYRERRGRAVLASLMSADDLDLVLGDFPPVSYAFAYGSGVFRQRNYSDKQVSSAMTDVVLAVDDPAAWHAENLTRNREHYSGLAWFGPSAIAAVQRRGAGLYFNPYARVSSGRLLKYGVVSRSVLEDDLSHWNSLYVAGRMHKPVRVLCDHAETAALAAANHRSALTAALLMLPAEFNEDELYLEVSRSSKYLLTVP